MDGNLDIPDSELRERLKIHGVNAGPITDTTRKVYINHLAQLDKSIDSSTKKYSLTPEKSQSPVRLENQNKKYRPPRQYFSRVSFETSPRVSNSYKTFNSNSPRLPSRVIENFENNDVLEYNTPIKPDKNNAKTDFRSPYANRTNMSNNNVEVDTPSSKYEKWAEHVVEDSSPLKSTPGLLTNRAMQIFKSPLVVYIAYIVMIPVGVAFFYPVIFHTVQFAKNNIMNMSYIIGFLFFAISFFYLLRFMYKRYKMWSFKRTKEKYQYIDKILEILKSQCSEFNRGRCDSVSIPVLHIRDLLFSPSERKSKNSLWEEVFQFVSNHESRVQTEVQNISGKDCHVWKWIGTKVDLSNSLNAGPISKDSSIFNSLSACLKVYVGEGNESKFEEFSDEFMETIRSFGFKIMDSDLVKTKQTLYLKLNDKTAAVEFFNRFNKAKFLGRTIKIKFIKESNANKRF